MTDVVTYTMSLGVEGGPIIAPSNHFDAEAYEKLEPMIVKNSVPTTVNVQPSELTQLQAIIITAQRYTDLSFTVDEEAVEKVLDGPLMLIGPGNIANLGATVNDLIFTNTNVTLDNMVTILVARTAVEPGT